MRAFFGAAPVRIYVAGVFLGALLGIYIQHFEERMGDARSFTVAAAADAGIWMFATGMAMDDSQFCTRSYIS